MDPIDSDLLAGYLAGEADPSQRQAVEVWAAASSDNARELQRMRTLWDLGGASNSIPEGDLDAAWTRLEARIAEAEGRGRIRSIGGRAWPRWLAAAAIITGVVFAARWFLQPKAETYTSTNEMLETMLADNSRSVLSPGSRLEVRIGRERNVILKGEAYFEVVRDTSRPFVVRTGEVEVTVLGTAFEVSAYDTSAFVLVRVRSGRVRVEAGGDSVELTAGQHARFDRQRHFLERKAAPPSEVWGIRILHFEGATLHQVVDQLQRLYRVRIDLRNDAIGRCTLTAEFEDEPVEDILQVIAETFGLELTRDGTGYALDGEGC